MQEERSLHSAARRAIIRRGRKNRAAPVGMTVRGRRDDGEGKQEKPKNRSKDRPLRERELPAASDQ